MATPLPHRACLPHGLFRAAAFTMLLLTGIPAQAKPTILGDYYQETTSDRGRQPPQTSDCSDTTICYYIFSRVPRGKFLVVTNVSCHVLVVGASDFRDAKIMAQRVNGQSVLREHHFVPTQTSFQFDPNNEYTIGGATSQLFAGNDRPLIYMEAFTGTLFEGTCTIEGRLFDAP